MSARIGRAFPRGWRDFVLQLGIWFGFFFAYQIARGIADRDPAQAFQNGRSIIDFQKHLHTLVELDLQNVILRSGGYVLDAVNWTYWLSQFAVLGVALLWIYFFRNEAFRPVRNWILAANMLALVGYVLLPTAPPRMFPDEGFVDTLLASGSFSHENGLVQLASNPYAAMPSVHAADALIIGFCMAALVRTPVARALWTLWPTWVWFSVMATGNHYWLDVAGGVCVALTAAAMISLAENRRQAPFGDVLAARRRW
jgi:membrane-associated phospholipid phosphatase